MDASRIDLMKVFFDGAPGENPRGHQRPSLSRCQDNFLPALRKTRLHIDNQTWQLFFCSLASTSVNVTVNNLNQKRTKLCLQGESFSNTYILSVKHFLIYYSRMTLTKVWSRTAQQKSFPTRQQQSWDTLHNTHRQQTLCQNMLSWSKPVHSRAPGTSRRLFWLQSCFYTHENMATYTGPTSIWGHIVMYSLIWCLQQADFFFFFLFLEGPDLKNR